MDLLPNNTWSVVITCVAVCHCKTTPILPRKWCSDSLEEPKKLHIQCVCLCFTGEDILAWIANHMKVDTQEARTMGTMLVAYGFIYPLQDHKRLILKPDGSLYRFQTPYFWPAQKWKVDDTDYGNVMFLSFSMIDKENYNKLHKWLNYKWDFIVMQAKEQYRAGKERNKADRVVFDCQERAFWIVHRPPVSKLCNRNTAHCCRNINVSNFLQYTIMRPKVKSTVSLGALVKFMTTYKGHDPFLAPCLPSNPWQTDDDTYWELNMRSVETPTKMRVERWSFSFFELLSDPRGRADFKVFLKKEFSGENLAFWEAAEEMKWGAASSINEQAQTIFK
uniref:Regulator of G protein signaling 9a n=1 Tax=Astyanax mexicanus TaxID=7994 RepID=A0A8B9HA60_ASTMX